MCNSRRGRLDKGCSEDIGFLPFCNRRRADDIFLICDDKGFIGQTRILDCRIVKSRRNRGCFGF